MSGLRITEVDTAVVGTPWKPWVYVRLDTNTGVTGYGEATYRPHDDIVATIESTESDLVGLDPFETEKLTTPNSPLRLKTGPHHARHMSAISGLDIAMWDIKGKHLGCPVYELLGGSVHGTELRTYANGWYTDVYEDGRRRPERFAEAAERVVSQGYDALKFDPFGNAWRTMNGAERERSIECIRAVRETVGPEIDLMIEGHKRFGVGTALDVADRIAEYDPTWFEEPVPQDVTPLKKVAARSPVPVATGETMVTSRAFSTLLHETAVGTVQPDVVHAGGITELEKIAAMADAEQVELAPHTSSGWLTLVASLHVDASAPNFYVQENFAEFAFPDWADELVSVSPEIGGGRVEVPDGPGLGTSPNWERMRTEYSYERLKDEVSTIDLYEHRWEQRNEVDRG